MWGTYLFRLVDRWVNYSLAAIRVVHQGLWLGLLSPRTLQTISQQQYADWKKYRDTDYNRSGLFAWEHKALERFFCGCKSILVGAAGGGRELLALSKQGRHVDAFDCCPELVADCQRLVSDERLTAQVLLSAPDDVPPAFPVYDGLIMGWGAYTHIAGAEMRIRFLERFRRHVRPNGPILLSFFVRKEESTQLYWTFLLAQFVRRLRRGLPPIELGDSLRATFDHYFTKDEIVRELEAAGFQLTSYTEEPYGHAVGRALPLEEVEKNVRTSQPGN